MAMLVVNDVDLKDPSSLVYGLQDISDSASGRTQDTIMHKNRVGQKRKLSVAWKGLSPRETAEILQAVNPEYIDVEYDDALSGKRETRTFYVGDRSAPVKIWTINNKRYETLSFDLIER